MSLADDLASYNANADYDVLGDVSKARAFVVACRRLLASLPKRSEHAGTQRLEFDPAMIQEQLEQARLWLAVNDPARRTAGTYHADLRNFRE